MDQVNSHLKTVAYVHSEKLIQECDRLPAVAKRASLVHTLIESYGLIKHMKVVSSKKATIEELKLFHSSDFVEYLQSVKELDPEDVDDDEFGFSYDCPAFENMLDSILTIAGSSLSAALSLINNEAQIAINWNGGWHHAQRDEAEGFCYVNDIVIAIEKLKERFHKILYIDLDIHHGNGVENAFSFSKSVFTLSFHKYEPGFYPGTGNINDIGSGNGRGYACNVPFKEGLSDDSLCFIFENITPDIFNAYKPDAVVVQCGSDCLNEDPLGQCNVTLEGMGRCIKKVLTWSVPTMFLGGGGYNKANAARLWTYLTAIITKQEQQLNAEIPDNDHFLEYGPGYELFITRGCQKDMNSKDYLEDLVETIQDNIYDYLC